MTTRGAVTLAPTLALAMGVPVAIALAGCKADKPPPEGAPSAVAEASSAAPASAARATASVSAVPSGATSASPDAVAPTALHLVARSNVGRVAVVPSKRGALLVAYESFVDDPPAMLFDGDAATPVHDLFKGLGLQDEQTRDSNHVHGLFGRYPDRLFADVLQAGGRSGSESFYYAYGRGSWSSALGPDDGPPTILDDHLVAVTAASVSPLAFGLTGTKAKFPREEPPKGEAFDQSSCTGGRAFGSDVVILVSATPAGELFLLSYRCHVDGAPTPVVDVYAKGATDSRTTELPFVAVGPNEAGWSTPKIFARSATEAYVSGADADGKGYLARFDGAKWTRETRPLPPISDMAGAEDGTLWLLALDRLVRRAPDGALSELRFPAETATTIFEHVVATSGAEAWVFGENVVVSTREPKAVVQLDGTAAAAKPATADCKTVFVQLYAITKLTPPNFDFPKTREAMKGHKELEGVRFVVTKDRRFGAIVRSLDEGKSVQRLAQAGVRGARPELLCLEPEVERVVKFDLETSKPK